MILSGEGAREENQYQIKKSSGLDWYHMIPQFGCLVFTLCPTSSFAICRQCAQMFSVAFGEEVTAEILQCKQLGNAAVHQVPWGREGGPWWKVRRDKELGERLNHS